MLGITAQILSDLHAEFAGRHNDQASQAWLTAYEFVQHRQAKRCCLAATCLAETNQFFAAEDLGNGVLLDLSRLVVAGVAHTLQDGLVQSEGIEAQSYSSWQWPPDVTAICSMFVESPDWLARDLSSLLDMGPTYLVAARRVCCLPV